MDEGPPGSLAGFIDEVGSSEKALLLLNRTEPVPMKRLLDRAFENQAVTVTDRYVIEGRKDIVCLVDDGEVTATTPLSALEDAFLLINADRYRTGTVRIQNGSFPDVLTGLDEVEFRVRGYPESNKEKLLLVLMSRFIEFEALSADGGELHSTFQRLSRLDDEFGTQQVYEWLADSAVDTHIYGVNDAPTVANELDVTVHADDSEPYRRSWVLVFTPPAGDTAETDARSVALVAELIGDNRWRGMWTYDPDLVSGVRSYMRRQF